MTILVDLSYKDLEFENVQAWKENQAQLQDFARVLPRLIVEAFGLKGDVSADQLTADDVAVRLFPAHLFSQNLSDIDLVIWWNDKLINHCGISLEARKELLLDAVDRVLPARYSISIRIFLAPGAYVAVDPNQSTALAIV